MNLIPPPNLFYKSTYLQIKSPVLTLLHFTLCYWTCLFVFKFHVELPKVVICRQWSQSESKLRDLSGFTAAECHGLATGSHKGDQQSEALPHKTKQISLHQTLILNNHIITKSLTLSLFLLWWTTLISLENKTITSAVWELQTREPACTII